MANNGKQCLTIQEIAVITGKAQNTIYRYIREGKLKGYNMANNGKQCLTVTKENIERFFGVKVDSNGKQWQTMLMIMANNGKHRQTMANKF